MLFEITLHCHFFASSISGGTSIFRSRFTGTWQDGDIVYYNNVVANSLHGLRLWGEDTHGHVNTQLVNNIIVNNIAGLDGGGISLQDVSRGYIANNTIANNDSTMVGREGFPGGSDSSIPAPAGVSSHPYSAVLASLWGEAHGQPLSPPAGKVLEYCIFGFGPPYEDPANPNPATCAGTQEVDYTNPTLVNDLDLSVVSPGATSYYPNGVDVTVVEMLDTLVPISDPEVGKTLARSFKKRGMKIRTGTRVVALDREASPMVLTVESSKGEEKIETDLNTFGEALDASEDLARLVNEPIESDPIALKAAVSQLEGAALAHRVSYVDDHLVIEVVVINAYPALDG